MGKREVEQGPTAERVRANVRRFRREQEMTLAQLADALRDVGRPIVPSGIGKIEQGERRVDVDDLVALALALDVSPNKLLFFGEHGTEPVQITPGKSMPGENLSDWAMDDRAALRQNIISFTSVVEILARELAIARGQDAPPDGAVHTMIHPATEDEPARVEVIVRRVVNDDEQ